MQEKSAVATVGCSGGPDQSSVHRSKGSQPDVIDKSAEGTDWLACAARLVQDITAALQQGSNDIEPISDAPSYEALSSQSIQLCEQLLSSSSSITNCTPQQLHLLRQMISSVMELSTAMLCDPAVAMQLIAAGNYAAAAGNVKSCIKLICGHLLETLKAAAAADGATDQQQQQSVLQALLPAVKAVVKHLLEIALTQAAYVSGSQPQDKQISHTQIPKELKSMAVLNISWGNMCKLLLETPVESRLCILQPQQLKQGLQCALQQLLLAVRGTQVADKKEVLARFWLQNAQRLVTVAGTAAAGSLLGLLMDTTVELYGDAQRGDIDIQGFLQQQLQPRMITCLSVLLSCSPDDPAATQSKLDCLLHLPHHDHQQQQQQSADPDRQQQQQQIQAHVLVILDLMQHLQTMQADMVQQCCQQLLLWVIRTAGGSLSSSILAAGPAGSALLQHVLHCCLVCCVGCAEVLQQQQQQRLIAAITSAGLDPHPLVSFIARQLLAELLSCSSNEAVKQQLSSVMELLEHAAACCALPEANQAAAAAAATAESLVAMVVAILQAQDPSVASSWVQQHCLSTSPFSSSSGNWLDPSSCALLSHQCSILLQLGPVGAAAAPQSQVEECLNQLWVTAQQVLELLDRPHWQQQQQSSLSHPAATEQLLVLHQLMWQMEAMQALVQLLMVKQESQHSQGAAAAAAESGSSTLVQSCTELAINVLTAITNPSSSSAPAAAVHTAATAAALKVLAAAAHVAVAADSTDKLLQLLKAVTDQQEGLHYLVATVVGNVRVTGENSRHEALFQLLLASPHWPVRHAATASLILHLQYNNFAKSGIPRLLPDSMKVSATEAKPEAVEVIKSYLHKRPDAQAQAAYESSYQQLAHHYCTALVSSTTCSSDTTSSSSSWSWRCIGSDLQQFAELLSACGGAQVDSEVPGSSSALQALMKLAAAAGSSLEAVEQAVFKAESEVQLLMSAATAAAQGQQLSSDEVMMISRKGSSMVGSCASLCSRLRAMQDKLTCLKS